jgi:hypothetical protein
VRIVRTLRRIYVASGLRALLPSRLKNSGRGVWSGAARAVGYPISSPQVPRPALSRGRVRMRLSHVLLGCDLNARYLESWPLVSRAWEEVAGLDPVLVLVADETAVPEWLRGDRRVRPFAPVEGVHTAFQSQCVRLLYPALLDAPGAVLISDMELVPMRPGYFHDSVAGIDERFFVPYRGDIFLHREEIAIPYNAARPATWAELFGIAGEEDVRRRLAGWAGGVSYEGVRGGSGWYTDQLVLYRTVLPWGEATGRLWLLDDQFTGYNRLERAEVEGAAEVPDRVRRNIRARRYTDFNSCIPHGTFAGVNETVLELALESLRAPLARLSRAAASRRPSSRSGRAAR